MESVASWKRHRIPSWKIDGGHTITQSYSVNTAANAIRLWVISTAITGASQSSIYPTGSPAVGIQAVHLFQQKTK
ncbi:hypothetical protein J3L18_12535 [Mucilaginibacter gossypii]|uniref:hypothetical protein n=1 Tax=Mucilaginibacter gossypii TaxID=551996 RepID=UPI000DCEAB2C|nr:hypothetical protein [Mucilaginibacter gossypii]QTE39834.1 hypothetical protein J3L18_12535 [Mucilaginibacter gossypii]RAV54211.1 hypothetical protein DIU36_21570 [Mucilaginibacter rubeus]